jgi:hypothetical protein
MMMGRQQLLPGCLDLYYFFGESAVTSCRQSLMDATDSNAKESIYERVQDRRRGMLLAFDVSCLTASRFDLSRAAYDPSRDRLQ